MKKQRFFMLGIITVLVAVLSLTFVSSTFARYTTTNNGSDTARVAKWGVNIAVAADDDVAYETDLLAKDNEVEVVANTKVIAPGSAIKFADFAITGKPEVAVKVTYTATLTLDGWKVGTSDYMPVVFVINGTEYKADTMEALKTEVETAIGNLTKEYAAGTDLAASESAKLTVTCYWPFETTGNNANDTALGNAAATATAPTINLTITCTVDQTN